VKKVGQLSVGIYLDVLLENFQFAIENVRRRYDGMWLVDQGQSA